MENYSYSITDDFPNGINLSCLHSTIEAADFSSVFNGIINEGDDVEIMFETVLSGADQTLLDQIVADHEPDDCPVESDGGSEDPQYFDGYYEGETSISDSWTDMPISSERQKTTAFTHTSPSAEVTIATEGTYIVQYKVTITSISGNSRSEAESRLMLDIGSGYGEVDGSISEHYARQQDHGATATSTVILDLNVGDKLKVQSITTNGNSLAFTPDCSLVIYNAPAKGLQGEAGPPGSGASIVIQDEGVAIPNAPHSTLDFRGDNFSVADQGSGVARVTSLAPAFGSGYAEASSLTESSTSSTSWQNKLTMTVNNMPAGRYMVNYSFEWAQGSNREEFEAQVQIDDGDILMHQETQVPYYGYGSFTTRSYPTSGFSLINLTSGSHTFDLDYRTSSGGTSYIRRVRIIIWMVSTQTVTETALTEEITTVNES